MAALGPIAVGTSVTVIRVRHDGTIDRQQLRQSVYLPDGILVSMLTGTDPRAAARLLRQVANEIEAEHGRG